MKTLIIAPNARIADLVARSRELRLADFVYVRSIEQAHGHRGATVLCYYGGGSWSAGQWDAWHYLKTVGDGDMVDVFETTC